MAFLSEASKNETLSHLNAPASSGALAQGYSLAAYTLPANAFKRVGQAVRIRAFGTTGTNANTKTIALRFGGTTLNASATGATSNGAWKLDAIVVYQGAANLQAQCDGYAFAAALAPVNTALTTDMTAAQVIDILGTNGSASADVTVNGFEVEGLSD